MSGNVLSALLLGTVLVNARRRGTSPSLKATDTRNYYLISLCDDTAGKKVIRKLARS
jgi:hypothetical protein